jgi:hypothetical protein
MARNPSIPALALLAALLACGASRPAHADAVADARRAFQQHEYATVIDVLLPLEQARELTTAEPLMWLALACGQARIPPRNARPKCYKRRADIMVEAAELGDPRAMFDASIGLMDTGMGRFGLHLPFAGDANRVDALMWAVLASELATDRELRTRAAARAQQLARNLQQEWRGQETLAQRAYRQAEARKPKLEAQMGRNRTDASTGTGGAKWLDAAALRKPWPYRYGKHQVVVTELDFTDQAPDGSDEGVPPTIDPGSIARQGDRIQYVYAELGDLTLVQARCSDGTPTLLRGADYDPTHPDDDTRWVFPPAYQQPIPRDRDELDYYRTITRKACSIPQG